MQAVHRPHPDLNPPPLAIRHQVGANVVLPGAQNIDLKGLEVAGKSEGSPIHDARGAELGQLGNSLPERVNLVVFTTWKGKNWRQSGKKGRRMSGRGGDGEDCLNAVTWWVFRGDGRERGGRGGGEDREWRW